MRVLILLSLLAFIAACTTTEKKEKTIEKRVVVNDTIPYERSNVNPKPVATYRTNVPDDLNAYEFSVRLYETPLRFRYRVNVRYKTMNIKDSVDIPNFGIQPKVDVRKHKGEFSCMIGFYDAKGNFKDLKKVEVDNNAIKIVKVQRYGVGTVRKK